MKTFYKLLIIVSGLLVFTACEDVVQIKLDEGSKLYVIDAFVNDLRADQVIRVTTNDSYFSNRVAPPVPDAQVILTDLTDNKQYTFNYTGDGNYVYPIAGGSDTIAKINHQYRLDVTIDGSTYTSLTVQKRTAVIDTIIAETDLGGFGGPPSKDTLYYPLLSARDKADNNPDYYWIKTFRNDTLFTSPADLNVCIDGTGGVVTDAPADTIDFSPPGIFLSFKPYRKNDKIKVEIHSLSKDNYYFFIQASTQINNGGLFATTPENVKTNITTPEGAKIKGIGRFNMAAVASYSMVITGN